MKKEEAWALAERYLSWADIQAREKPEKCPARVVGERVFLRQKPDEVGRILHKSFEEQRRPFMGILIGAGDQACDQLYDQCQEWGDEVWIGKYAGVQEEWKHWLDKGNGKCGSYSDHNLEPVKLNIEGSAARFCTICGALEVREPMVICNVKDILANVDLELRIERGEAKRYRGVTADGATRYVTERTTPMDRTTWDENPERKIKEAA